MFAQQISTAVPLFSTNSIAYKSDREKNVNAHLTNELRLKPEIFMLIRFQS